MNPSSMSTLFKQLHCNEYSPLVVNDQVPLNVPPVWFVVDDPVRGGEPAHDHRRLRRRLVLCQVSTDAYSTYLVCTLCTSV